MSPYYRRAIAVIFLTPATTRMWSDNVEQYSEDRQNHPGALQGFEGASEALQRVA